MPLVGLYDKSLAMRYQDVVEHFGKRRGAQASNAVAAAKLGITRQGLLKWKAHGIPRWRQELIELRTRGKLKAS